jgi:hypothetical protein
MNWASGGPGASVLSVGMSMAPLHKQKFLPSMSIKGCTGQANCTAWGGFERAIKLIEQAAARV